MSEKDAKPGEVLSGEEAKGWEERFQNDIPPGVERAVKKDPRPKYNFISWLFFLWLEPFLWHGMRKGISQEDIFPHPYESDSKHLVDKFNYYWEGEMRRKRNGKKPRLFLSMMRCILGGFLLQGLLLAVEIVFMVTQSVILGYLTDTFLDDSENAMRDGYLYAMGLVLCGVAITFLHGHNFLLAHKLGMQARVLMTSVIYQKVTRLSQVSIGKLTVGHIVNLASNDVQRFDLAFLFPHIVWVAPIHLVVVTYLAYIEVGWSAFIITGFVVLQIPLQILLAKIFSKYRFKAALITDKRIRIMNEVITGMKVIKMYAWEYAFKHVVSKLRGNESSKVLKGGLVRAFALAFMIVLITVVSFLLFSTYAATGGVLTPKSVFTVLSLVTVLRLTTVHFMVQNSLALSEGYVAITRINKLLSIDDSEASSRSNSNCSGSTGGPEVCVSVDSLSAAWPETPVLEDVSFSMDKENPLLAIVGSVGAGKTSLLQCLLSELEPRSGSVRVSGALSYASQEPWLFSASLRDNVLFGSDYDPVRYSSVIEACALNKDIVQLVNGDLTLVGERGVTLSGGQKARVSLARAVYHQADVYLLDDPLSAVDTAVAKHLFDKCIRGLLRDKLVVMVTHQVQFALRSDQILGLKEGKVEVSGNVRELLARNINLKELLGLMEPENDRREAVVKPPVTNPTGHSNGSVPVSPLAVAFKRVNSNQSPPQIVIDDSHIGPVRPATPSHHRKHPVTLVIDGDYPSHEPSLFSSPSLYSLQSEISTHPETTEEAPTEVVFQPPEERSFGSIPLRTYFKYFLAGGNILVLLLMLTLFILGEGSLVVADWWLSDWSYCSDSAMENVNRSQCSANTTMENRSTCSLPNEERIASYGGILAGVILFNFAKTMVFYFVCVNASRVLHNRMFQRVLKTPMLFFDTNPIGRILNRFSKDIGFLDDLLPYLFCEFILLFSRVVAIVLTALVALPWLFIPCVVLAVLFMTLRWYYIKTARDVKRLELIARSPVYSHFSSTLQGLPIIRSFNKTQVSIDQLHSYQNQHTGAYWVYLALTRWLGIRMDLLSNVLLAVVAFISVPLAAACADEFDPALISLALTYTLSLSGVFQYVVRISADIENIMVSAERVDEYSKLETEASLETLPPHNKPNAQWPKDGSISFENVSFRYSPDLPLVLNNLSFSINSAEKIGVVGRTGAGKSSLLSVIFRLAEPFGSIIIDGIDIKSIGLHDLRKRMSIIPQDPVLFTGTMRHNLDPFNEFEDSEIWNILEKVQLKLVVEALPSGLAGEVSEGGSNFSVGQKQLVCLARAMLRRNRILILDEATANVDIRTDEIIQNAIREEFSDCTVVTIAHRLNTIMDSDRILVLSCGELREIDTPYSLLQDRNSLLSEMVRKTGPETSHKLQQIAHTVHIRKLNSRDC